VHVGLPTERERESILQVHVQRMKLSSSTDVIEICKTMAQETVGFSGADIAALVRSAAVRCLNETSTMEGNGVEMRHFLDARKFDLTEPSSNNTLVEKLLKWRP
jgi:SpoVK/Ycf46/Vps4 family AAA+-type ATPase